MTFFHRTRRLDSGFVRNNSMTDKEVTDRLNRALEQIESRYPGCLAAYDGFSRPRYTSADYRIEVFGIEQDSIDDAWTFLGELAFDLSEQLDLLISAIPWDSEVTAEKFSADIAAIKVSRLTCDDDSSVAELPLHFGERSLARTVRRWLDAVCVTPGAPLTTDDCDFQIYGPPAGGQVKVGSVGSETVSCPTPWIVDSTTRLNKQIASDSYEQELSLAA